jgi:dynein heavy chain 2
VDLNQRKGGIEEELSDIQPLIDAACKAVGQIKSDNLTEIKSLKMPPDAIRDVLEGVLILMGQTDTSWSSMRQGGY